MTRPAASFEGTYLTETFSPSSRERLRPVGELLSHDVRDGRRLGRSSRRGLRRRARARRGVCGRRARWCRSRLGNVEPYGRSLGHLAPRRWVLRDDLTARCVGRDRNEIDVETRTGERLRRLGRGRADDVRDRHLLSTRRRRRGRRRRRLVVVVAREEVRRREATEHEHEEREQPRPEQWRPPARRHRLLGPLDEDLALRLPRVPGGGLLGRRDDDRLVLGLGRVSGWRLDHPASYPRRCEISRVRA